MNKICHWISNGSGRGKRYLLLLSLLFSALTCSIIYIAWNNVLDFPETQKIIEEIPELKVQDGQLVKPYNTYYQVLWHVKDAQTSKIKKCKLKLSFRLALYLFYNPCYKVILKKSMTM